MIEKSTGNRAFIYRGVRGSIEWSEYDQCYYGQILSVKDIIFYEGANEDALTANFKKAVDSYLGSHTWF